jgi:hypothetical protein
MGPVSDAPDAATRLVVRGVGALAADAVAQAAELVAGLARAAGLAEAQTQAAQMHARASALSVSNELAFTRASRELAAHAGRSALSPAQSGAVDVPLEVCVVASDLVALAGALAAGPLSTRRADLCGVAQLAAGACDTAALLVRGNAVIDPGDERRGRAQQMATTARAAAGRLREGAWIRP